MRVLVLSQADVEAGHAEGTDAIISIRASAPASSAALDLAMHQAVLGDLDASLVLRFDDIGIPAYGPCRGPTMDDVSAALEFARSARVHAPDGTLAVHCRHGVSRSSAVALALVADALGPGREAEAVAELLRQDIDARFQPNPMIVGLADAALYRYGQFEAALAENCSRYVAWREWWRTAALDPEGHYARSRTVSRRRRSGQNLGA